ncbi:MAG: hypothetical protein Q8876_01455 [Bacillota bacterium]|nr:hypothetical protein [Bacillota bacterium]
MLKKVKGNSVNNLKGSVNFTSGDLHYAVGKANFYITGTKQSNGKWSLSVKVADTYNFDEIRTLTKGITKSNLANDLGWAMQKIGMAHTYFWSVTFSKAY